MLYQMKFTDEGENVRVRDVEQPDIISWFLESIAIAASGKALANSKCFLLPAHYII